MLNTWTLILPIEFAELLLVKIFELLLDSFEFKNLGQLPLLHDFEQFIEFFNAVDHAVDFRDKFFRLISFSVRSKPAQRKYKFPSKAPSFINYSITYY